MDDTKVTVGESAGVVGSEEWFDLKLNDGTDDAWEEILRVDGPDIWRIVRGLVSTRQADADDLAQDLAQLVRQRLWQKRGSIDPPARAYFTYRRTTCQNVWFDWLRRRRTRPELFLEDLLEPDADGSSMDALLPAVSPPEDPDPMPRLLKQSLGELTGDARQLVELHYFRGVTLDQVAITLGVSYRTVKRLHQEVKKKLAISLKKRMVTYGYGRKT